MISVWLWLPILVVGILAAVRITFTLTRLDRLHARLDAAFAALDAQLVRRAAALLQVAESIALNDPGYDASTDVAAATAALQSGADGVANQAREGIENRVGRSIAALVPRADAADPHTRTDLHEACIRLIIARRFYNDAVRDTRTLRRRRTARILHLAGHRQIPQFFDVDDAQSFPDRPADRPTGVEPDERTTTNPPNEEAT